MYKNYLFDLDGTLLPMDMQKFVKLYFGSLCQRFVPVLKVEPNALVNAVWKGTNAMGTNDNKMLNKDLFWQVASDELKMDLNPYIEQFDDYYANEFVATKQATTVTPFAKKSIEHIKNNGGRLIAATNPIFPKVATYRRLQWAGLDPQDFEFVTVYENSGYCKPNLKYYEMICNKCNILPEESIMVGNDVDEDLCSAQLGFDTYLVTDCIINRRNKNFSVHKNGTFENFYKDFLVKK